MADGRLAVVLRHLRTWVGGQAAASLTDAQLLHEFVQRREETAFAALVQRHAPMVYGVCRRMLSGEQDAEDAFQATFMVLARRAASIRKRQSLAGWLYGVARRVALKARLRTARQRHAEKLGMDPASNPKGPDAAEQAARSEAGAVVDEELQHLPEKYRLPLILCYFQGLTYEEAADELGLPSGSMGKRLHQAQDRLRQRLVRRGVALSVGGLAAALSQSSQAAPAALESAAVRTSLLFAGGKLAAAALPAPLVTLAESVLQALWLSKVKQAAAAVLVVALLVGGGSVLVLGPGVMRPRAAGPEIHAETATLPTRGWQERWAKSWKNEFIACVALDPDGKIAAVGRADGTVTLLDVASSKETGTLGKKKDKPNAEGPQAVPAFGGGAGFGFPGIGPPGMGDAQQSVTCLTFSPDGKTVAAASSSGTIHLWDVATRREKQQLEPDKDTFFGIQSLAFAPDGKSVAAAGSASNGFANSGWIKQWDIDTAKTIESYTAAEASTISHLTFCSDRSIGFMETAQGVGFPGVARNVVKVMDLPTKKVIWESKDGILEAQEIISNPGGKLLAFLGANSKVYIWNPTKRDFQPRFKLAEPSKLVGRPVISPDGRYVASVQFDSPATSNLNGASAPSNQDPPAVAAPGVGGFGFGFGYPGGGPGFTSPQVRFFDGITGKLVHALPTRQGFSPSILTFSGNGQALAIAGMSLEQTEDADPFNPFGGLTGEVRLLNLKSHSGLAAQQPEDHVAETKK